MPISTNPYEDLFNQATGGGSDTQRSTSIPSDPHPFAINPTQDNISFDLDMINEKEFFGDGLEFRAGVVAIKIPGNRTLIMKHENTYDQACNFYISDGQSEKLVLEKAKIIGKTLTVIGDRRYCVFAKLNGPEERVCTWLCLDEFEYAVSNSQYLRYKKVGAIKNIDGRAVFPVDQFRPKSLLGGLLDGLLTAGEVFDAAIMQTSKRKDKINRLLFDDPKLKPGLVVALGGTYNYQGGKIISVDELPLVNDMLLKIETQASSNLRVYDGSVGLYSIKYGDFLVKKIKAYSKEDSTDGHGRMQYKIIIELHEDGYAHIFNITETEVKNGGKEYIGGE